MQINKKIRIIRYIIYAFLAVTTAICIFMNFYPAMKKHTFISAGFEQFKYYTVLSNLFLGITSLISFIFLFKNKRYKVYNVLRYIAVTSAMVTFITVLCYLGPRNGYKYMYLKSNLFFHLINPLLGLIVSFLEIEDELVFKNTFHSIDMVLIYGTIYFIAVMLGMSDFYGFNSAPVSFLITYPLLFLMTFGIGVLVFYLKKYGRKVLGNYEQ